MKFKGFNVDYSKLDPQTAQAIKQIILQSQDIVRDLDETITTEGITYHQDLKNLDYESSGHTGFQPTLTKDIWTQYLAGQTYNGVALNVTATNGTVSRGVFIPYQISDGSWRLRLNFSISFSDNPSAKQITINGVTFKNVANYDQGLAVANLYTSYLSNGVAESNSGVISVWFASGIGSYYVNVSGDVELDSKPTWAN